MIQKISFFILLVSAILFFYRNSSIIYRNICLGKKLPIKDNKIKRWKTMLLVAIGQSKISKRPVAGFLHIIVYLGFIIVNIELIEILTDGIVGTHRFLSFLPFYSVLISILEIFAILVIIACIIFLFRRNVLKVRRFQLAEISRWPRLDANIILFTEIVLMLAFLTMNTADTILISKESVGNLPINHLFVISSLLTPLLSFLNPDALSIVERAAWWIHIVGIFAFLNYIPYSKHFHIILAFPNVYYSKLKPLTYISNMDSITKEVKIAMGLLTVDATIEEVPSTFGASDIRDFSWKSLMDAYSCTECGRCTAVCPANLTGKKLSPRKIVMDTRDRLEELGNQIRKHGTDFIDGKTLLYNYIAPEEIWACTTCNACTYECPVNIDPVSIIIELRRYIFMEKSAAPSSLNAMSVNIENNGAPWQYSIADRFNWSQNLMFNK